VALLPAAAGAVSAQAVLTNSIGMEFVRIQPGRMVVGRFQPSCPSPDPAGADRDPRTAWTAADFQLCQRMVREQSTYGFPVTIARPFYIGRYEVTQEEWERVMGSNP